MIKQEQNTNEMEIDALVSIVSGLKLSIREGLKTRNNYAARFFLKKDIATLRLVRTSKLFTKKF